MRLALIPGHRPDAPGASAAGFSEYPLARVLCELILQRLPDDLPGFSVQLFTRPNVGDGLTTLIQDLNAAGVDGALSIHFNATAEGAPSPDCAYSLTYPGAEKAGKMADTLRRISFAGIPRLPPKGRKDLAILSDTAFPVALDEPAYIDRRGHRLQLLRSIDKLAMSYAGAIQHIHKSGTLSDGKDAPARGG